MTPRQPLPPSLRSPRRRLRSAVLALSFLLAFRSLGFAEERAEMREHFRKGTQAFDLGQFDEAIAEYGKAYRIKEDPALLYNLGQAHRAAGHTAEALHFYKVYLHRSVHPQNRAEVEAKIAQLQEVVDQQRRALAIPPETVKPVEETAHAEPAPAAATVAAGAPAGSAVSPAQPTGATTSSPVADAHQGRRLKTVGLVLSGVGLAAAGAGIGLAVVGKKDVDDLTATARAEGVWNPGEAHDAQTFQTTGFVLIGLGAATAVVGGVLAVVGTRRAHAAAPRHLARLRLQPGL
jgi:tetratricopeptide (TPR) repeat protein